MKIEYADRAGGSSPFPSTWGDPPREPEARKRWVHANAVRAMATSARAGKTTPTAPYGVDTPYADPGYQDDGKKRYPLDTYDHVKAAWSYINQAKNAAQYTADELAKIKARIRAAAKHFGIAISDGTGKQRMSGLAAAAQLRARILRARSTDPWVAPSPHLRLAALLSRRYDPSEVVG